jgi:hypothetical protein
MLAVIVQEPVATPVITPVLLLTVALAVLLELYVIVPSPLPADGLVVAVTVPPTYTLDGADVNDIVRLALLIEIVALEDHPSPQ